MVTLVVDMKYDRKFTKEFSNENEALNWVEKYGRDTWDDWRIIECSLTEYHSI